MASTRKKPVIFVTEDEKKDWWWRIEDRIVGPRPELIEEMKEKASVSYYSYSLEPFMKHTKKYLKETIDQKALSEITERSKLKTKLMSNYLAQLESIRNSIDISALAKYRDSLISLPSYYTPGNLESFIAIQKSLSSIDFINKYRDILPQSTWGLPALHGMPQQDLSVPGDKQEERKTDNEKQQEEDKPNDEEEKKSE